jgi:hypothetical protein
MKFTTGLVLLALVAVTVPAGAQSPEPVPARMTGMFPVYVMDTTGGEEEGSLVSLTDSLIVLQQKDATRTIDLAGVSRVYRKGDSLKNGALIGAGVGLVFGVMLGGFSDCPGARASGPCTGARIAGGVGVAAVYAAIGTAIDALIPGRTLIWRAGK